uniref:Uncharacterized protein n=1 Tax=Cacopsylla melanoneura TaxID=428564 RepID=A0A8D8T5V8_9HEMI
MSSEELRTTIINGTPTLLHQGFTYSYTERASPSSQTDLLYECIRPECKGRIRVQHYTDNGLVLTSCKFLEVVSKHNDIILCTKRFTRSTDKPKGTVDIQKQINALDLTIDATVYENCVDSDFDNTMEATNALANIKPSADVQDLFVKLKNEIDILLRSSKCSIDTNKFHKLVGDMFKILNDKCSQVGEMKLRDESLTENLVSIQKDYRGAQEMIKDINNRNKILLEEYDEQMKQFNEKQKVLDQLNQNLSKRIQELTKSPKKMQPNNDQAESHKVNLQDATTQYNPVDTTPKPECTPNQHDVTHNDLTQESSVSHDDTIVTITSAVIDNQSQQISESYVSISKFLELESKMKTLEHDILGLKNGMEVKQNEIESVKSHPQKKSPLKKPDKRERNPNVFIVGDGHVRNMKEALSKIIPSEWSIKTSYDQNAILQDVSNDLIKTVKGCDHLILFAGSNDMFSSSLKSMKASLKTVMETFKDSKQIHLLLVPERYDDISYNYHIKKANEQISETVAPYQNVTVYNPKHIVDCLDYCDNFFIDRQGKIKICTEIAKNMKIGDKNTDDKTNKIPAKHSDTKKNSLKFKVTKEPKNSSKPAKHQSDITKPRHFKGKKKDGRSFVYHTYQTTSKAPRYSEKDAVMTSSTSGDLDRGDRHYASRYYSSRQWDNTSHRIRGRNF